MCLRISRLVNDEKKVNIELHTLIVYSYLLIWSYTLYPLLFIGEARKTSTDGAYMNAYL